MMSMTGAETPHHERRGLRQTGSSTTRTEHLSKSLKTSIYRFLMVIRTVSGYKIKNYAIIKDIRRMSSGILQDVFFISHIAGRLCPAAMEETVYERKCQGNQHIC